MKVLMVGNSKRVKGGINSVMNSLLQGLPLCKSNVKVTRFASYTDQVPPVIRPFYSIMKLLVFLIKVIPYQIVHMHSAANGSFYRKTLYTYFSKWWGKKVIFHIHGSSFEAFQRKNSFTKWIVRKTLDRADAVVVLSEQMKMLVHRFSNNPSVHVLPNPIEIPDEQDLLKPKDYSDKVNLLFLGEIGPRKGIYDLVQALASVPQPYRNQLQLHVCGNNEIEKLKSRVQELGLEDCCTVRGWIDGEKKKYFLRVADIYILPSYAEGLPISILEAMAYSLPIISTNVGGIPEIVRPEQNGILVEPGAISDITSAILQLITDSELRDEFGKQSREIVDKHELKAVVKQLNQLYISMVDAR
ncbi:glycosyltransferase family 4 protein [Paenibacillus sp. YYML68]|uniref:glycosyltransferase family 4 protein n=1 Tax=Paenibacillus sp. YYML68 TaxID=2909250 RepID=UPI00248F5294|nr:glycosyltransferase family 4 protein [Paenibacillus sp. YYML68]